MGKKNKTDGLSPMQKKFVECYDGNGYASAVKAGYSEKNARMQACRLLTKEHVVNAIKKRNEKATVLRILSREERQNFWTRIVLGEEDADMKERLKASELLGRSQADFTDNLKINKLPEVIIRDFTGAK